MKLEEITVSAEAVLDVATLQEHGLLRNLGRNLNELVGKDRWHRHPRDSRHRKTWRVLLQDDIALTALRLALPDEVFVRAGGKWYRKLDAQESYRLTEMVGERFAERRAREAARRKSSNHPSRRIAVHHYELGSDDYGGPAAWFETQPTDSKRPRRLIHWHARNAGLLGLVRILALGEGNSAHWIIQTKDPDAKAKLFASDNFAPFGQPKHGPEAQRNEFWSPPP